jgi:hypothetical protein
MDSEKPVYCGSERSLEAAALAYPGNDADLLVDALIAAHDPALGLDRSVCLRDVVEARDRVHQNGHAWGDYAAGLIEREFATAATSKKETPE